MPVPFGKGEVCTGRQRPSGSRTRAGVTVLLAISFVGASFNSSFPAVRLKEGFEGVRCAPKARKNPNKLKLVSRDLDRAIRTCLDRYDKFKILQSGFNTLAADLLQGTNTTEATIQSRALALQKAIRAEKEGLLQTTAIHIHNFARAMIRLQTLEHRRNELNLSASEAQLRESSVLPIYGEPIESIILEHPDGVRVLGAEKQDFEDDPRPTRQMPNNSPPRRISASGSNLFAAAIDDDRTEIRRTLEREEGPRATQHETAELTEEAIGVGDVVETISSFHPLHSLAIPQNSIGIVQGVKQHRRVLHVAFAQCVHPLKVLRYQVRKVPPEKIVLSPLGLAVVRESKGEEVYVEVDGPRQDPGDHPQIRQDSNGHPITKKKKYFKYLRKHVENDLVWIDTATGISATMNRSLLLTLPPKTSMLQLITASPFRRVGRNHTENKSSEEVSSMTKLQPAHLWKEALIENGTLLRNAPDLQKATQVGDVLSWRAAADSKPYEALDSLSLPRTILGQDRDDYPFHLPVCFEIQYQATQAASRGNIFALSARWIITGATGNHSGINGAYRVVPNVLVNGRPVYEKYPTGSNTSASNFAETMIWMSHTPKSKWVIGFRRDLGLDHGIAWKDGTDLQRRSLWYTSRESCRSNGGLGARGHGFQKYNRPRENDLLDSDTWQGDHNIGIFLNLFSLFPNSTRQAFKDLLSDEPSDSDGNMNGAGEFVKDQTVLLFLLDGDWVPCLVTSVNEVLPLSAIGHRPHHEVGNNPFNIEEEIEALTRPEILYDLEVLDTRKTRRKKLSGMKLHNVPSWMIAETKRKGNRLCETERGWKHPISAPILDSYQDKGLRKVSSRLRPDSTSREGDTTDVDVLFSPSLSLTHGRDLPRIGFRVKGAERPFLHINGIYVRVEGRTVNGCSYFTKLPVSSRMRLWACKSTKGKYDGRRKVETWWIGDSKNTGLPSGDVYLHGTPGVEDYWFSNHPESSGDPLVKVSATEILLTDKFLRESSKKKARYDIDAERPSDGESTSTVKVHNEIHGAPKNPFGPGAGRQMPVFEMNGIALNLPSEKLSLYSVARGLFNDTWDVVIADTAKNRRLKVVGRSLNSVPGKWISRSNTSSTNMIDVGDLAQIENISQKSHVHLNGLFARVLDVDASHQRAVVNVAVPVSKRRDKRKTQKKNLRISNLRPLNTALNASNSTSSQSEERLTNLLLNPEANFHTIVAKGNVVFTFPRLESPHRIDPISDYGMPKSYPLESGRDSNTTYQILSSIIAYSGCDLSNWQDSTVKTWTDLHSLTRKADGTYDCVLSDSSMAESKEKQCWGGISSGDGKIVINNVRGKHIRVKPERNALRFAWYPAPPVTRQTSEHLDF